MQRIIDSAPENETSLVANAGKSFQPQQIVLAHANLPTITHCYSQLIDIIQSRNLQTVTLNDSSHSTPITPVRLLDKTRRCGYAIDYQENELGTTCVAVPVRNLHRRIVAAISVSASSVHMTPERIDELVQPLTPTAVFVRRERARLRLTPCGTRSSRDPPAVDGKHDTVHVGGRMGRQDHRSPAMSDPPPQRPAGIRAEVC
jgi:Bacterial transcriptional regulator